MDPSYNDEMNASIGTFGSEDDDHHNLNDHESSLEMADYSTAEGSDRSHRNSESIGSACFFADATLPLESAHALAETPEPVKFVLSPDKASGVGGSSLLTIPSLQIPPATPPPNAVVNDSSGTTTANLTSVSDSPTSKDGQSNRRSVSTFNRITNADQQQHQPQQGSSVADGRSSISSIPPNLQPTYRPRPPRRPRDPMWAMAWLIFVPLSLMFPFYPNPTSSPSSLDDDANATRTGWFWVATTHAARSAALLCILISFGITQVIARVLYRTMGGGDGDSARQKASQVILAFAPLSAMVHPLVILLIWARTPSAFGYAVVPLAFFLRDIWALRQWRGMPAAARVTSVQGGSSWHDQGRQTFFQALSCMALDVLSRSLRRQSFYRIICSILIVQLVTVWAWQKCLVYALAEFSNGSIKGLWFICIALIGGKWATGTVARILGYVASGGITSWFAQQSILMEEMEVMKGEHNQSSSSLSNNKDEPSGGGTAAEGVDTASDDSPFGYAGVVAGSNNDIAGRATARAAMFSMPEAYREADASAYQSVLDLDEGIDDDFEDEDGGEYGGTNIVTNIVGGAGGRGVSLEQKTQWTGGGSGAAGGGSTVKAFLISAATVSFGSVAQCGLLGGLAQFAWRTVRNFDAVAFIITHRFSSGGRLGGFRGMQIGRTNRMDNTTSFFRKMASAISSTARSFVRSHSDLALSHVAAYYKSYQRAAGDVAVLIDASGVEPILHDDITTHICACVCGSISGMIVIAIGYFLSHNRVIASTGQNLSDKAVVECMFVSFIMCYTLLFTVMEPLRASIKAIYVCFAQHPQSLSQAFPLIFHRLSRIAEANAV